MRPFEKALVAAFILLATAIGWFFSMDATGGFEKREVARSTPTPDLLTHSPAENKKSDNTPQKSTANRRDNLLDALLALPNERIVHFKTDEDYQDFLKSLKGTNLRVLGRLDTLRSLRIGFDNLSDLESLLDDDQMGYNYLVTLPLPPGDATTQASAVSFNSNALAWLGITGDNSSWGEGTTIAILDSGISDHSALTDTRHLDLVDGDGTSSNLHGHGTAVASLIAGQNSVTPGVSPSADILDVRVADSEGNSSSFLVAEGILAAVAEGADIINISLGSYGNSSVLQDAIEYAYAQGVVIVASAGNEGFESLAYPAGYESVIGVGAVDANGEHLDFSNTGDSLDLTAPGLDVYAAWLEDSYITFTGTSASAPYVTAAIAATMSEFDISAQAAAELVMTYANEAGYEGSDPSYGNGLLDVGRTMNSNTPGIYDLAAVSNLVVSGETDSLLVLVQNQGTEALSNSSVTVYTPTNQIPLTVPSLSPGEVHAFELGIGLPSNDDFFSIETQASINGSFQDSDPSNNIKVTDFIPSDNP